MGEVEWADFYRLFPIFNQKVRQKWAAKRLKREQSILKIRL